MLILRSPSCRKRQWLLLEPVELADDIVTGLRGEELVAPLALGEHRIIQTAHYRPLDARTAELPINVGHRPAQDGTDCRRPNGLGIDHRGEVLPDWLAKRSLNPLP